MGTKGPGVVELGKRSTRAFFAHRMTTHSAALAYRGLFGLFLFALLVVALLGVLDLDGFFERSLDQAGSELPGGDSGVLVSVVEEARRQAAGGLISFGVAVALYSIYALARTLVYALNALYEVGETRPAWKRFLLLVAFGPALAVASVAAMLVGSRLAEYLAGLVGLDEVAVTLWTWLRLPVALIMITLVLSVVYRVAPNVEQPYRLVTTGAAVAVVAWIVSSVGFSLYLTACVVLFGAEVNAAGHRYRRDKGTP